MQLTVDCIRFGDVALTGGPHGAFDVLRLGAGNTGTAIARVEVERGHMPALKMTRLDPDVRFIGTHAAATVRKAVLATWRDNSPSHFELSAVQRSGGLEIVLSGDCHHRLFWWRAQFRIHNGELLVHGPFLANDPDT